MMLNMSQIHGATASSDAEDRGNTILAVMDTWLKKSAQMSGELQARLNVERERESLKYGCSRVYA